ncbi:MAG: hypothetical protein R6X29_03850 [Acidimicrobiia bacterium]
MTLTRAPMTDELVSDGLIEIDGESYYGVSAVDRMPPFLMSVVSDGDRWMFVSSTGALTAGRADASCALFPYVTDDRLHGTAGRVGPVTALRVSTGDGDLLWIPFQERSRKAMHRRLYKSVAGNVVVFEEANPDLRLSFRYRWAGSDRFGFVRTATLVNQGDDPVRVELVDGLVNLLPYGLDPFLYQAMSNLTNAYKRSELVDTDGRLAVFSLESRIADRPEPAEVLRATAAWSVGLAHASVTISPEAVADFEAGRASRHVSLVTGTPGAYLLSGAVDLDPGDKTSWHIVADVGQDQVAVARLRRLLQTDDDLETAITASIREATESLIGIMAPADALQRTGDRMATAHQIANVTYNVMRGGIPLGGYEIATAGLERFVVDRNRRVADRHRTWFDGLPATIDRGSLLDRVAEDGDTQLMRLVLEYLPFSFSRRHGDPSRPWNVFSIRVRDEAGCPIVHYEGNWRDIFQNWEALCLSFPEYLPSVISVFVNASTPDGFNPYRITSRGIDWEVPDPDDPWSHIGYWGDHQIVYLLRLLEASDRFLPGAVERMLSERWFCYADVPYRLAPYGDLVRNPKETIAFDEPAAARSAHRVAEVGGDGKLVWDADGEVLLVSLAEKLLVPALTKLSNLVPGGGIWMNTQRPEWNDANNALAGFGLSMVTLHHLRRYLRHLASMIRSAGLEHVDLSKEVADWMTAVATALGRLPGGDARLTDRARKTVMDELGQAFSDYRARVYTSGFSGSVSVAVAEITELCDRAIEHLDATIRAGRRPDGLYHAYNLVHFEPDGSAAGVEHLHEMLEGQVAVLDSGVLSAEERADLLDALFSSAMYRADQHSFMLYPVRHLPPFLDKNVVPPQAVTANPLLEGLLEAGDRSVIVTDVDGRHRFNPDFSNRGGLETALDRLAGESRWSGLVATHRKRTLATYEQVFRHHAYTGRSGSMYGYEGIGSIYWHMVAKLLVAVQDSVVAALTDHAPPATLHRLVDAYWRVRSGLGFNKTAEEFGAIPLDPYSHSPAHAGAQQPGMTGLVKEELLTRMLEVGVRIEDGQIVFDPVLLRRGELLPRPETWTVYGVGIGPLEVELDEGSLGMTLCQVPVIVALTTGDAGVEIVTADGSTTRQPGLRVDRPTSAEVFARSGEVARILAHVPAALLRPPPEPVRP